MINTIDFWSELGVYHVLFSPYDYNYVTFSSTYLLSEEDNLTFGLKLEPSLDPISQAGTFNFTITNPSTNPSDFDFYVSLTSMYQSTIVYRTPKVVDYSTSLNYVQFVDSNQTFDILISRDLSLIEAEAQEIGYNMGVQVGYNNGYEVGYDKGFIDGNEDITGLNVGKVFNMFCSSAKEILSIEVLPKLSVGTLISIPVVFAFVIWFVNWIRGN